MELILLASFAAVLVWGAVFLRVAGLWGYILIMLIAGTVFGHPFFHLSVLTSDRALLGTCLLIYAAYRWLGIAEPKKWLWVDSLIACFIGIMILTTFASNWRLDGAAPVSRLLFFFLLPTCVYWLARQVQLTPLALRWMFGTFACLGLYLAVTAVAEKYELRWAVFPKYIADPNIQEFLGRARGPLLNPSANGVLLTLGLSCALMFYPMYGKLGRIGVIASLPIYLFGIYCTLTRCVWMGGAAALFGITWLTMPKRFRIPFAITILIGGVSFVAIKSESLSSFKRDKHVSVAEMRQSAQLRPMLAAFAWQIFQDRPLMGCGTGQYLTVVKDYLGERKIDLPLEKAKGYVQHNIFLSLLSENGLLGMLPFTALLLCWTWSAWQLSQSQELALEYRQTGLVFLGFMAGYLWNGMFQDVLIMSMISMYLFFMAGCIRNLAQTQLMTKPIVSARVTESVNSRADPQPAAQLGLQTGTT